MEIFADNIVNVWQMHYEYEIHCVAKNENRIKSIPNHIIYRCECGTVSLSYSNKINCDLEMSRQIAMADIVYSATSFSASD